MSLARTEEPAASRPEVLARLADHTDHAAIRELLEAAYGQYEMALGPDAFDAHLEDLLDLDRHAANGALVVAEIDGVIQGSAAFYPDIAAQKLGWPPGWAGGRGLAVHPSARGLGVAQALIATAEDLAVQHGAPVFAFHTLELMSDAISLYNHLGYVRAPEFDQDLRPYFGIVAGLPIRAIAFRRDLPTRPAGSVTPIR